MPLYEARAVSYPGKTSTELPSHEEALIFLRRERSDSLPEPRHFRRLRREIDLDSDLDRLSDDENAFLKTKEAQEWQAKRVVNKLLERVQKSHEGRRGDVVVISADPMGPPTRLDTEESPATIAQTHVPWNNWSCWDYGRSKSR